MAKEDVNENDILWIKRYITEMREEMNKQHQAILEQTTKTNGRVTKLEDRVDSLDKTQAVFMAKVTAIAGAIATAASFVLSKIF